MGRAKSVCDTQIIGFIAQVYKDKSEDDEVNENDMKNENVEESCKHNGQ